MDDDPVLSAQDEQQRRTLSLNIERTWLAWWRTALVSSAAAVGLGRVAPEALDGHDWPYLVVGVGYGALAVILLALGGYRQRTLARALDEGRFIPLQGPWVAALTISGAALAMVTMVLVLAEI